MTPVAATPETAYRAYRAYRTYRTYRSWHRHRAQNNFALGEIQLIQVEIDKWISNMIGQRGTKTDSNGPPIRYDALQSCLTLLNKEATRLIASIHMPKIGCGLAGGRWSKIEPLLFTAFPSPKTNIYIYEKD